MNRSIVKSSLIGVLLAISFSAYSRDFVDEVIQFFDQHISHWQTLRQENALIKSREDLALYENIRSPQFPLNKLSAKDREVFLDSLEFNDKGLTTFNYMSLEKLAAADRFKLLSLFGAEHLSQLVEPEIQSPDKGGAVSSTLAEISSINNHHERKQALKAYYHQHLQPLIYDNNKSLATDATLQRVLDELDTVSFYVDDPEITLAFLRVLRQAETRGLVGSRSTEGTYGSLLKSRMFREAQVFYQNHPGAKLPPVPVILPASPKDLANPKDGVLAYAALAGKPNTFQAVSLPVLKGKQLLVLAHPVCHFCFNAAKAIAKEPELTAFLETHAVWLSPPDRYFGWQTHNQWNQRFPATPIAILKSEKKLPMLDSWGTPTFYFMENGKVMDKIVGWPKEGRMDELKGKIKQHFGVEL